jgi:hypothetical protein
VTVVPSFLFARSRRTVLQQVLTRGPLASLVLLPSPPQPPWPGFNGSGNPHRSALGWRRSCATHGRWTVSWPNRCSSPRRTRMAETFRSVEAGHPCLPSATSTCRTGEPPPLGEAIPHGWAVRHRCCPGRGEVARRHEGALPCVSLWWCRLVRKVEASERWPTKPDHFEGLVCAGAHAPAHRAQVGLDES